MKEFQNGDRVIVKDSGEIFIFKHEYDSEYSILIGSNGIVAIETNRLSFDRSEIINQFLNDIIC
jgi:hypothetical protein